MAQLICILIIYNFFRHRLMLHLQVGPPCRSWHVAFGIQTVHMKVSVCPAGCKV